MRDGESSGCPSRPGRTWPHQYYPFLVWVVLVRLSVTSTLRLPSRGGKHHEQVAYSLALVFVIVGQRRPEPRWARLTSLLKQLLAGLVQAYQHFLLPVIHLQHILHGEYKLGAGLGRDTPTLFQPGLESVFSASAAPYRYQCCPLSPLPPTRRPASAGSN